MKFRTIILLFAPIWIELIELLRSSDGRAVCGLSRMMTGLVSVRAELGLSRPDDFPKSLSSIPVPPIPTRGRVALTDRSLPVFLLLRRLARPERSSDESLPEYSSEEYLSVFAELRLFVERAARFVELSASFLWLLQYRTAEILLSRRAPAAVKVQTLNLRLNVREDSPLFYFLIA